MTKEILFFYLKRIKEKEHKAFLVGGSVRDAFLGETPKDFDLATSARPEEIMEIFSDRKTDLVGKSFGVVIVDGIEIATFRSDRYFGLSDKSVEIKFSETIEEDLSRRDLTINSIAMDPLSGEIVDPYNGYRDLMNRIIRFVGNPEERILEDPNRVIRACRFLALIDGEFEKETLEVLKRSSRELFRFISPERIRLEILKAMKIKRASRFFEALNRIGILENIFPEILDAINFDGGKYHSETIWEHIMLVGDDISTKYPLLKLSGYLHDIGKPKSSDISDSGERSFLNHEKIGKEIVVPRLENLRFSNKEIKFIGGIIESHMRLSLKIKKSGIRRIIKNLREGNQDFNIRDLIRIYFSDKKGNLRNPKNNNVSDFKYFLNLLKEDKENLDSIIKLEINGFEIMELLNLKKGGKEVGVVKNFLENLIVDFPELNNNKNLRELVNIIILLS